MFLFIAMVAPIIPWFVFGYGHEDIKVSKWNFLFDANKKSLYHNKTLNKNSFWGVLVGDKIQNQNMPFVM